MLSIIVYSISGLLIGIGANACWLVAQREKDKPKWQRIVDVGFACFFAIAAVGFAGAFLSVLIASLQMKNMEIDYKAFACVLAFACACLVGALLSRSEMDGDGPVTRVVYGFDTKYLAWRARRQ